MERHLGKQPWVLLRSLQVTEACRRQQEAESLPTWEFALSCHHCFLKSAASPGFSAFFAQDRGASSSECKSSTFCQTEKLLGT